MAEADVADGYHRLSLAYALDPYAVVPLKLGGVAVKLATSGRKSAVTTHHGNLAGAFDVAFWWSAGFSVVAVLLSLWLPGAPRARRPEADAPREAAQHA